MSFIISNKRFDISTEYNGCFYSDEGDLIISPDSISFVKTNSFGQNKDKLKSLHAKWYPEYCNQKPFSDKEFYLAGKYFCETKQLYLQTDIVASHTCFMYRNGAVFFVSDNVLKLITVLKDNGYNVSLIEREVRKYIVTGNYYTNQTIFKNITVLKAAVTACISFDTGDYREVQYDSLETNHSIVDVNDASNRLFGIIDNLFETHHEKGLQYGLGVSGGLDSRVAGFFAARHNYDVEPFFIGREYNGLGFRTNDACRSIEVSKALGYGSVLFVDDINRPYDVRLEDDVEHSPLGSANISQNIGYDWHSFDVLLHGMMGGELFGGISFLSRIVDVDPVALAELYINSMCLFPKSIARYSLSGKVLSRLPLVKNAFEFKERDIIIDAELYTELIYQVVDIIQRNIDNNMSPTNALIKLFMQSQSRNVITGYYSTLESTIPSLGVYFNPQVIREMLNWDDELFHNRVVQKALLMKCGSLSQIRDQTISSAINQGYQKGIYAGLNIIERAFRGSGMYYETFKLKSFEETLTALSRCHTVKLFPIDYKKVLLCKSALSDIILKIAYIESEYDLSYE